MWTAVYTGVNASEQIKDLISRALLEGGGGSGMLGAEQEGMQSHLKHSVNTHVPDCLEG